MAFSETSADVGAGSGVLQPLRLRHRQIRLTASDWTRGVFRRRSLVKSRGIIVSSKLGPKEGEEGGGDEDDTRAIVEVGV